MRESPESRRNRIRKNINLHFGVQTYFFYRNRF